MTTVIHIKDVPSNWKENSQYVYIGRGSKWGNDWSHIPNSRAKYLVKSREEAIDCFKRLKLPNLAGDLHELKDKILVCFCKPKGCHGDPLAEAANEL